MSDETSKQTKPAGFLSLPMLRDIVLVVLIAVFGWKMMNAELKIDLASFGFTDLLALILALFSVLLSVAFYFKATDASNQFYDNTYRFTKEMSEMLGRIEAGFGEKLKHIDEGYSGIRDRFDRMSPYSQVTEADVKKEEEEVRQKEQEQKALIEDLAKRAKLAEHEKSALFANLSQKSEELDQARMELRNLQTSSHRSFEDIREKRQVMNYLARKLQEMMPEDEKITTSPLSSVRSNFVKLLPQLPREAVRDMQRFDLLDEKENLTRDAVMRLRMLVRNSSSSNQP